MAWLIAFTTVVSPAHAQQTKPAEPDVAAANRAVESRLPFSDRQDFEDAMRGFIATTPDTADPDRYEAIIAGNESDHAASGHWGVPTFVFENEPFFGQDRIELLIWRMESRGLTRRSRC